jgi:hypothetical protein
MNAYFYELAGIYSVSRASQMEILSKMTILRSAVALVLASSPFMLAAQTPVPAKGQTAPGSSGPLIVDVHSSPYRATISYSTNISLHRFDIRDATVLDLIISAYRPEDQAVIGGPSWTDCT